MNELSGIPHNRHSPLDAMRGVEPSTGSPCSWAVYWSRHCSTISTHTIQATAPSYGTVVSDSPCIFYRFALLFSGWLLATDEDTPAHMFGIPPLRQLYHLEHAAPSVSMEPEREPEIETQRRRPRSSRGPIFDTPKYRSRCRPCDRHHFASLFFSDWNSKAAHRCPQAWIARC